MDRFLDKLNHIWENNIDKVAFIDLYRTFTYRELNVESAKIYAYLKKNNIGKEDFVQIVMPRGGAIVACMLGILKAGAAFAPFEDTYPKDRLDYIKKDINAKFVLNKEVYEYIMQNEVPLSGYEKTDVHDAAYVIYTSGSTGNPKGVLHEYGNIDQQAMMAPQTGNRKIGLIVPFNFVAAVMGVIVYLLAGDTVYIIDHDVVKDFNKFTDYILDKKIQNIYMSPSYIRIYKNPSPYLDVIVTGSEPADGIFYEGGKPQIKNTYGMSEAGFQVLATVFDKAYDVAPVGKPTLNIDVCLVDDDGKTIDGTGKGELCFKNEYVRGYINLPEKTEKAFINGIYHTGDILQRDETGMYYYVGRSDDMFKINGNRIEPAEIEASVKEVTGLKQVVAKGFQTKQRNFICLYYLKSQAKELKIEADGELKCDFSILKEKLPEYMLPTYYIGLDSFPINANGKLAKKNLEPPIVAEYQKEYMAPTNEAEVFFCKIFEDILVTSNVGVEDDFYLIGGDSLRAISFIGLCSECGCQLNIDILYECRTPKKLAKIMFAKTDFRKALERFEEKKKTTPAKQEAVSFADGQITYYGSCFGWIEDMVYKKEYYICTDYYLKEVIEPERLQKALNRALLLCPYPGYKIEYLENDWHICFRKSEGTLNIQPIPNEGYEEKKKKDQFCYVMYKENNLRIYLSHAITDGQGIKRFADTLLMSYFTPDKELVCFENKKDYAVDLLAYRHPVTEGFIPIEQKNDGFIIPEYDSANNILHKTYKITIDKIKMQKFCYKHNINLQVLSSIFLAKAVTKAHPENEKDIVIRIPVNTRVFFNTQNTFQNASMPHIYLRLSVDLIKNDIDTIAKEAQKQLRRQLNKDNISYCTNKYYDAVHKNTSQELIKLLLEEKSITEFYVSDLGDSGMEHDIEKHIDKIEFKFMGYGFMLSTSTWGPHVIFNIVQRFEPDIYIKAFVEIMNENIVSLE